MAKCETCGNRYDQTFEVIMAGKSYTFDSFECAIHLLAPACANCKVKIVGHGILVEVKGEDQIYCCAHCARAEDVKGAKDHIAS